MLLFAGRDLAVSSIILILALMLALPVFPAGAQNPLPLQLPYPHGVDHRVSGYTYGCGTHSNVSRNYYAIDFNHFRGERVSATLAGTVVDLANPPIDDRGNFVEVDHLNGYHSRYLHLRDELDGLGPPFPPEIFRGATVSQGQLVGYSGDTPSVDPHLHFDMQFYDATGSHAHKAEPLSGWTGFGRWGTSKTEEGGAGCGPPGGPEPFVSSPSLFSGPPDDDGDGFPNDWEVNIGTYVRGRCEAGVTTWASLAWPADLRADTEFSADRANAPDLATYVVGDRPFPSQVGGFPYSSRWDINRTPFFSDGKINVLDLSSFKFGLPGNPPMFDGQRAYKNLTCTNHPAYGARQLE